MIPSTMTRLPWFKFYWIDWLSDSKIRRCSLAARGLLIELLCLMADSEERGYLITGNKPWSNDDIAKAVVGPTETIPKLIEELLKSKALERDSRGALIYPDMAHDASVSAARSKASKGNKSETKDEQNADKTSTKPKEKGHKVPASPLVLSSISSSISDKVSEAASISSMGFNFKSAWPVKPHSTTLAARRNVWRITEWFSGKITTVRMLSDKAGARINARLKDYTADELCKAIDNYAASDWVKGGGQPKTVLTFFSDEIIARELKRTDSGAGEAEYEKKRQAELDERTRARQEQNAEQKRNAVPGALGKLAAQVLNSKGLNDDGTAEPNLHRV